MKMISFPLADVTINDAFWSRYTQLVDRTILPYQWEVMNDMVEGVESSHCLDNFKIAAGESDGTFYGAVFQDSDIAKWLEAVGYSLAVKPNAELEKRADEAIDLICKAQQEDGYLDTYFIIKEPQKKWKDLCEGHELYVAGHMIEAAIAYFEGTKKEKFLNCVCRLADLICDTFGEEKEKIHGYPGHQEIEIALVKLYKVTGIKKYLETSKYFLDIRGVGENYFLKEKKTKDYLHLFPEFEQYDPMYSQSHMPVREQTSAEGHAVRAVYMYCAMADIAYEYADEELLTSCRNIWNNIVNKRMYITGSIGSSGVLERFTADYDLPNDFNYSETCASIGLALFGLRMAYIEKDAKYIDIVERALYNTVLAGIAMDGKSFFYVNPLEVVPSACMEHTSRAHVKPERQKWFGVACCPPNITRTLASLGQYIYGIDKEEIYINLFVAGGINNEKFQCEITTNFPWENKITIKVLKKAETIKRLAIRIPKYAENFKIICENQIITAHIKKGYAFIEIYENMCFEIAFDAPAKFYRCNPKVSSNAGKAAIQKGPLVYCFEEIDNKAPLSEIFVNTNCKIEEIKTTELGGMIKLKVKGERLKGERWKNDELYSTDNLEKEEVVLKAVPYAFWNNRGIGEMSVWIKEV